MVAKEQQSQPLASQSPPAWASHTEHMMADSSEGGKQPQHHRRHETDALIADYYGSYSNSPQSQQSSNSLLTLSPRSSTSQASNPASLDFTKNMKYNDEHHESAAANVNIAALASLDSSGGGSKKASRVRKATPSKCVSSIAGAAAVAGNNGASNSMRSPSNLKCQLCLFATQNRLEFSQHLSTHCRNLDDIEPQEFTKLVMEQLSGNLGPADDLASPAKKINYNNNNNNNNISNNNNNSLDIPVYDQSGDELGLRVPRVQTNGKVKLFRCKQCPYVAIVKVDFWDHSRQHIKPEKLLTCPKCPFVTEYKHHLEYHLRNHFGSKPFKCEQCDYSCVNKSMLNSHLKSHSDVYQFRCNECNYATKYCHSLKLHLRKYNHTPSVVLNTDGTPNPLPIVDVYGTRRGPKTKSEDTTPPPQDIVSALLPVVVGKLQPARQQKQQQQQLQTPPPQQESAGAVAVPSPPQYNFSNSSPIRFDSPIGGGSAPPQLPMTPAASPKSPSIMPYIDQEDAATTIHLLASLGGGPASFNPYIAAAAMQAASSRVAELGGRAGLRSELDQLTKITNPAFLGSADMCSRVLTLTLNILGEGVKHAESRSSSSGNGYNKKVIVSSLDSSSSSTDTASSQEGAPLDLSKANNSKIRRDDEAPQDLTKSNNNARSNSCDDDYEEEEEEDQEDDADEEYDADEQSASELGAIVAKLCRHKPVMRSVHGSLAFLRQYLMFLRAAQLQSLGFM